MDARQPLAASIGSHDLLPSQLNPRSGTQQQPEQRLMLAVLEDAVLTFRRYAGDPSPRARRLYLETATWFASEDTTGPFSFVSICQALDLEPGYLRRGLLALRPPDSPAPEAYRGSVSGRVAFRMSPVSDSMNANRSRFSCAESSRGSISFERF